MQRFEYLNIVPFVTMNSLEGAGAIWINQRDFMWSVNNFNDRIIRAGKKVIVKNGTVYCKLTRVEKREREVSRIIEMTLRDENNEEKKRKGVSGIWYQC